MVILHNVMLYALCKILIRRAFIIKYTLQKMTFSNCVTVTQNMCKGGFLHVILR